MERAEARPCLAGLLERRSVSPKRLGPPGPQAPDIALMVQAALRAPDHGSLRPWRIVEFGAGQRAALAALFEQEKRRRDPMAAAADLQRARDHATGPPALFAFVVAPQPHSPVPLREQWLGAGAALGNLLNAAHLLGYGASMLSGERCLDERLPRQLGVGDDEVLAGFVSIGSVVERPRPAAAASPERVWSCWRPLDETGGAVQQDTRDA